MEGNSVEEEARRHLIDGAQRMIELVSSGQDIQNGIAAFTEFRRGVMQARRSDLTTPGDTLDAVESKETVLGFVLDLYEAQKCQRQVEAVLGILLQVDSWKCALGKVPGLVTRLPPGVAEILPPVESHHQGDISLSAHEGGIVDAASHALPQATKIPPHATSESVHRALVPERQQSTGLEAHGLLQPGVSPRPVDPRWVSAAPAATTSQDHSSAAASQRPGAVPSHIEAPLEVQFPTSQLFSSLPNAETWEAKAGEVRGEASGSYPTSAAPLRNQPSDSSHQYQLHADATSSDQTVIDDAEVMEIFRSLGGTRTGRVRARDFMEAIRTKVAHHGDTNAHHFMESVFYSMNLRGDEQISWDEFFVLVRDCKEACINSARPSERNWPPAALKAGPLPKRSRGGPSQDTDPDDTDSSGSDTWDPNYAEQDGSNRDQEACCVVT